MSLPLVSFGWVPEGDAGARATLATMRGLVEHGAADPWAVAWAHRLVPPGDVDAMIASIDGFLADHFRFWLDPAPMDMLQAPRLLLQQYASRASVRGDCDDAAILAAFLARVAGIPYKFRAVAFAADAPYSHVYTLLRGATGWHSVDVTRNPSQAGPAARRAIDFP